MPSEPPGGLYQFGRSSQLRVVDAVQARLDRNPDAMRTRRGDRLICEAWNKRMLGFQGPAQPSKAMPIHELER